ncbi:hypothetical protein BG015_008887, partial [Linnemannia schmuckeri]
IIDIIATYLTQQDLAHCLCVNHEWHTTLTPSFWRVVRVVDETILDRFRTKETEEALCRNCHHIRVAETTDLGFLRFLATHRNLATTNLQSLTLRLWKEKKAQPQSSPPEPSFSPSSDNNPDISEIAPTPSVTAVLTESGISTTTGCVVTEAAWMVQMLLRRSKNLHTLSLDEGCFRNTINSIGDDETGNRDEFHTVFSVIPTAYLERLEISFLGAPALPGRPSEQQNLVERTKHAVDRIKHAASFHQSYEPFLALKELVIKGSYTTLMDSSRQAFLVRCPNVETLCINRLDPFTIFTMPPFLQYTCPKLSSLDWIRGTMDSDENIAELLRASVLGWRVLRLPMMFWFGSLALEALMESIETLEELRIEGCGQLRKNAILDLLCSAKNLRRLESVADGKRTEETIELKLHAYEAYLEHVEGQMDRTWALGPSIEFLQLKLLGVPRPDVWYNQTGQRLVDLNAEMDVALRFEVQRWIYTQLSRLTGVQELVLGITDFDQEALTNYGLSPPSTTTLEAEAGTFEEDLATVFVGEWIRAVGRVEGVEDVGREEDGASDRD